MKTTEEKNAMIAEFMGWKKGHPELFELRWSDEWFNDKEKMTTRGYLHFDTSWDWLMPVAHKCMESTDNLHPYAEASVVNAITRGLSTCQIHFAYDEVIKTIEFLQHKTNRHEDTN
jgi:hypothetical protein